LRTVHLITTKLATAADQDGTNPNQPLSSHLWEQRDRRHA
jgi:hypothetical protein